MSASCSRLCKPITSLASLASIWGGCLLELLSYLFTCLALSYFESHQKQHRYSFSIQHSTRSASMAPSVAQLEASEIKENIQQNSTSTTNGDHVPAPNEPAELNASLLEVTLTDNPKTVPPWNSAEHMTQRSCTDHSTSHLLPPTCFSSPSSFSPPSPSFQTH